ncbi:hypothetical protein LCGC14_0779810 [marine sediment metagenome]|uniref:Uncharacterized protein n=1 Tax=marine sediment metagenome TaxID=412755 RepID=A0A0F9T2Z8_9ZZZZ
MTQNDKEQLVEKIKQKYGYSEAYITKEIPIDLNYNRLVEANVKSPSGDTLKCWFGVDTKGDPKSVNCIEKKD